MWKGYCHCSEGTEGVQLYIETRYNLKVYSQLFQALVKVMVPVERLSSAFVFPNTFFNAVSSRPTVPHATLDWHIPFDVGFLSLPLQKLDKVDSRILKLESRISNFDFHDIIFFIVYFPYDYDFHDPIFFIAHFRGDDREESK